MALGTLERFRKSSVGMLNETNIDHFVILRLRIFGSWGLKAVSNVPMVAPKVM